MPLVKEPVLLRRNENTTFSLYLSPALPAVPRPEAFQSRTVIRRLLRWGRCVGEVGRKDLREMSAGLFEAPAVVWLCAQLRWEMRPGVASVVLSPVKLSPMPQGLVLRPLPWKQELRSLLSLACLSLASVAAESMSRKTWKGCSWWLCQGQCKEPPMSSALLGLLLCG